ncbi:YicC/YloC family endoribonuclease [Salinarimonas rosea]|uniref:YicC/YloC family endoribonuclease n=1 Tax=Salinarimonas rosea TaxID=552063 RepID=UPI0004905519|nr:YicC/YloC family endoribonuclease [Salinarimonas rosea]
MAIASMTGFAREAGTTGATTWALEAKSVNGRGLDVRPRTPPGFDAIGEEARRVLSQALARGQVQLSLTFQRASAAPTVRVNREVLQALLDALADVRVPDGVAPASLDGLLAVRGVIELDEGEAAESPAALEADLRAALPRLAEALAAARREEGAALEAVIEGHLAAIADLVARAEAHPGRSAEAVRTRLAAQVAALLEAHGGLDAGRLQQEAALIATRADIREELDRLAAHVAQARSLLAEGGAVGRRLDFLAQEFGREANTLCAKANDVTLSQIGLSLKHVVDQLREQVQNVE